MLKLVRTCTLKNVRFKLVLLYILNISDLVFTIFLIRTGLFSEINILLDALLRIPVLCFLVKVIMPGLLIVYITKRIKRASKGQLRISNLLTNIILSFYFAINLHHFVWMTITLLH